MQSNVKKEELIDAIIKFIIVAFLFLFGFCLNYLENASY